MRLNRCLWLVVTEEEQTFRATYYSMNCLAQNLVWTVAAETAPGRLVNISMHASKYVHLCGAVKGQHVLM